MDSTVSEVLQLSPDGKAGAPGRTVSESLDDLNLELRLTIIETDLDPRIQALAVPHYLVLEPHLPDATASVVRRELLTPGRFRSGGGADRDGAVEQGPDGGREIGGQLV
jgi:hypothetical protein